MGVLGGPNSVNSGLLIALDAANRNSNVTIGGTSLVNIANTGGSPIVANGITSTTTVPLDGTDDYIYIGNSISSATLSPDIATFSIWFNPSSAVGDGRANSLISRGNYNTAGGFFIHMFTNTVSLNSPSVQASFSHSTTTSYSYNSTSAFSLRGFNVWSNVTVVCDSTISIYVDGVFKETVNRTSASTIIYGNGAINTGGDTDLVLVCGLSYVPTISNGYWEPFKGDFSDFQMWNRRLTTSEIQQNYNATKGRYGL
jgi:hypothetical protein